MKRKSEIVLVVGTSFILIVASLGTPAFGQGNNGACEIALKQLQNVKKRGSLPYVCPKELGAQLESVLARIKTEAPKGYKFQKAILHIETGSTTELDAGINLVVFT